MYNHVRHWINRELNEIASLFTGDVINVSGGTDYDKDGHYYKSYFKNANSYTLSNFKPGSINGYEGRKNEILLDLSHDLPEPYICSFDVAWSYSVIESILEVDVAFRNTCLVSRDVVIICVPFYRAENLCKDYKDYYRFTLSCMEDMYTKNGLNMIRGLISPNINDTMLLFTVASRNYGYWKKFIF